MAMEVSTGAMISSCESKELNHLGLVAGMFDELGIGNSIDALLAQCYVFPCLRATKL